MTRLFWIIGVIAMTANGTLAADAILPESQHFMSGDQQFYLSIGALGVNTLFLILTYLKASSTHSLVNSQLEEFKTLLSLNAAKGVSDAREAGIKQGRDEQDAKIVDINRQS